MNDENKEDREVQNVEMNDENKISRCLECRDE